MKKLLGITFSLITAFFAVNVDAQTRTERSTSTTPRDSASFRELRPHVGLLAGVSDPEGRYEAGGVLGLTVGYQPYVPFGVSLQLQTVRNESDLTGGEDYDHNDLLVFGTYHFGGDTMIIREGYVGLGLGGIFQTDETIQAAVVPTVGFDIPIQDQESNYLTLGANAQYAVIGGEDDDVLALNGVVKYWY